MGRNETPGKSNGKSDIGPANRAGMEVIQENGAQAIRRVADLYEDGKDAQLKSSVIKKVLKGVDLSTKEFVGCTDLEFVVEDYFGLKAVSELPQGKHGEVCGLILPWRRLEMNTIIRDTVKYLN